MSASIEKEGASSPFLTADEVEANPTVLRNPDARQKVRPSRSGQGHSPQNQAATGIKKQKSEAMRKSAAYWALKPIELRLLAVIELEHLRHGGAENGNLIVTRRQIEKRGIPLKAIAPGLRALAALGFIEITQRGAAGIGDHAQAHRFRLTYVQPNPTHEWRKYHDPARATIEAETARKNASVRARRLGLRGAQKQKAGSQADTGKVSKWTPAPSPAEAETASIGVQSDTGPGSRLDTTIYISGGEGRRSELGTAPAAIDVRPPAAPPSPAVVWAEYSPSTPRQPRSPSRSAKPNAIVRAWKPLDGAYMIDDRCVDFRDQTPRRNIASPADLVGVDRPRGRPVLVVNNTVGNAVGGERPREPTVEHSADLVEGGSRG
jgi:hypothetical protein